MGTGHAARQLSARVPRRYDAMLGAGAGDGRFDDAEGEGEAEQDGEQ